MNTTKKAIGAAVVAIVIILIGSYLWELSDKNTDDIKGDWDNLTVYYVAWGYDSDGNAISFSGISPVEKHMTIEVDGFTVKQYSDGKYIATGSWVNSIGTFQFRSEVSDFGAYEGLEYAICDRDVLKLSGIYSFENGYVYAEIQYYLKTGSKAVVTFDDNGSPYIDGKLSERLANTKNMLKEGVTYSSISCFYNVNGEEKDVSEDSFTMECVKDRFGLDIIVTTKQSGDHSSLYRFVGIQVLPDVYVRTCMGGNNYNFMYEINNVIYEVLEYASDDQMGIYSIRFVADEDYVTTSGSPLKEVPYIGVRTFKDSSSDKTRMETVECKLTKIVHNSGYLEYVSDSGDYSVPIAIIGTTVIDGKPMFIVASKISGKTFTGYAFGYMPIDLSYIHLAGSVYDGNGNTSVFIQNMNSIQDL